MVPDPLSLGPRPYDIMHDPIPLDLWSGAGRTLRPKLSSSTTMSLYGTWPQVPWTLDYMGYGLRPIGPRPNNH